MKRKIGICALTVTAIVILLLFVPTLLISFMHYSPSDTFSGNYFIGTYHFARFFSNSSAKEVVLNSLVIGTISLIVGSAYVFIAASAIKSIKNAFFKGVVTLVFTLPVLLSADLGVYGLDVLEAHDIISYGYHTRFTIGCVMGIRYAAFFSLGAMFIKEKGMASVLKLVAVFAAFSIANLFAGNFDVTRLNDTVMNLSQFKNFKGNTEFDYRAAIEIIMVLLSVIPTLLAVIIAGFALKNKSQLEKNSPSKATSTLPAVTLAVIAAALLIAAVVLHFAGGEVSADVFYGGSENIMHAIKNSIIISVFSAVLVAVFATFAAYGISSLGKFGTAAVFILLLLSITRTGAHEGMRIVNVLDTHLAAILANLNYIPLAAILCAFVINVRGDSLRAEAIILPVFGALFAYFFCALHEQNLYLYTLMTASMVTLGNVSISMADLHAIPVLVAGACIMIGAVADGKTGDN